MPEPYRYQEFGDFKRVKPILPWKFFWFSLIFTLLIIGFYLFLRFYYIPHLKTELQKTSTEIHQLAGKINQKDRQEMVIFWSQIKNLETLLSKHYYPSNIFAILEEKTLPEVSLERVVFKYKSNYLLIRGSAKNEGSVANQIKIFENLEGVRNAVLKSVVSKEVKAGQVGLAPEKRTSFEIELYFDPKVFLYYGKE